MNLALLFARLCHYARNDNTKKFVTALGFTDVVHIESKATDTELYVCSDDTQVVVVFKATNSFDDWVKTNLKASHVEGPLGDVHEGFEKAYLSVAHMLLREIQKHTGKQIYYTGHSLGGALASVAMSYTYVGLVSQVYTYGSPRVFSRFASKAYDLLFSDRTFRYVMGGDFIARVPMRLMEYRHVRERQYYDRSGNFRPDVSNWFVAYETTIDLMDELLRGRLFEDEDHAIKLYISRLSNNQQITRDKKRDT